MDNKTKIKVAACRIAFLMPHQDVNSDIELEACNLIPSEINSEEIDSESPEYIAGAAAALLNLIHLLEEKGSNK